MQSLFQAVPDQNIQRKRQGFIKILPSGGDTKVQGSFQGVSKEGQKYGADFACEADFLEAVLVQNGVPASAILKECEATYTLENAEKTKFLIEKKYIHLKKEIL